jgi:hypothetical protein
MGASNQEFFWTSCSVLRILQFHKNSDVFSDDFHAVVNFTNILLAIFLCPKKVQAQKKALREIFVQKCCTNNVGEIDPW